MRILFQNERIRRHARGEALVHGGAERQQWLLARALAARGHDVAVAIFGERTPDEVIDGIVFRSYAPRHPLLGWLSLLARDRPEWWYQRTSDPWLGIAGPLVKAAGGKVVYACAMDTDCVPRLALARRRYLWPLYAIGLQVADRILVQHEGQLALLSPALRRKARLVRGIAGVGGTVSDRGGYVAWVGLLRETKRPHLLVEIAHRLPDVRFVVCGFATPHRTSPAYRATIEGNLRAAPNIDFRGRVAPHEAQRIIAGASVLLSTSSAEGFPNTFLQAWGSGVPVVSLELDPGGVLSACGAGVVARDVEDAASRIRALMGDDGLNRRLGEAGIAYVTSAHSEESVVAAFTEALK